MRVTCVLIVGSLRNKAAPISELESPCAIRPRTSSSRLVPRWVGALFIVSPFVAFLGLPGPLAELSDYLAFIALATIGLRAVRSEAQHPAPAPGLAQAVPTAP